MAIPRNAVEDETERRGCEEAEAGRARRRLAPAPRRLGLPARVNVPERRYRALGVEAEMQSDYAHEALRENAAGELFVAAGFERGDVPHRDLRSRCELFPAHIA